MLRLCRRVRKRKQQGDARNFIEGRKRFQGGALETFSRSGRGRSFAKAR